MNAHPRLLTITALLCLAGPGLAQPNPRHFATYLGGNSHTEEISAVTAAPNGDLIVAGTSNSINLPVTPGAPQSTPGGQDDVFVARLSPDASQVLACTYLGGTFRDHAYHVEVAPDGSIWVGGTTESANFPTTVDAFAGPAGRKDAFVAQLDGNLTTLLYSTAFGGQGDDTGAAFAFDHANQLIYVAGVVKRCACPVPVTPTAHRGTLSSVDAYLAVLDRSVPLQTTLAYGTYLGGSGIEIEVHGLSVDNSGIATVTGTTFSTDVPVTPGAVQSNNPGGESGFVVRIDPKQVGAASLTYGSYFGGSADEDALRHTVDANGVLHLLLISPSPDLPTTPNALISSANTSLDAYYAQVDPALAGSAGLVYGSWIVAGNGGDGQSSGGVAHDNASAIALGPVGPAICIATNSPAGISTTPGALLPFKTGSRGFALLLDTTTGPDPFVAYATNYHVTCGLTTTSAMAVGIHPSGDLLIGGRSGSIPVTPGAAQLQRASTTDGYVARLEPAPWPSAFRSFGATCAGTAGTPTLTGQTAPTLCGTMRMQVTGLPQGQIGAIYFGRSNTWAGLALPAPLAPIGGGSCLIHVGLDVVLPLGTGSGTATFTVPVPTRPLLVGQDVFLQYVCADAGANPLGVVTTNGIAAEVRW